MAYALLPDMDQALITYLTGHASLAALHGGRVATKLASDLRAVRISSLGGSQPWPWEDRPEYQVEWWGARVDADQGPAKTLARTGEAALWDLVSSPVAGGRVTGVAMPLSQLWSPDETTGRARYITHVALTVHPA